MLPRTGEPRELTQAVETQAVETQPFATQPFATQSLQAEPAASSALLSAAIAGLLVATAGCAQDSSESSEANDDSSYNRILRQDTDMSLEDFRELCTEREGWAYLTSSCAGSGMCRGLFLLGGTLSEHSCKGMNGCGGVGCVLLPQDEGKSAEEVLEQEGCANCHGAWNEDYTQVDLGKFTLIYGPGQTAEGKLAEFEASSDERLKSILVFGTQGIENDGLYFSNMPAYKDKLSLAEVERTVRYIKSMPKVTHAYQYFGHETADGGPPGHGAAPSSSPAALEVPADAGAPMEAGTRDGGS